MYTEKPSERVALLAVVNPQTVNNAAFTTPWVKLDRAQRAMVTLLIGNIDTTLTTIKLQAAQDNAGTGVVDLSGKTATSLTATDDNKQIELNVDAADVNDAGLNYTHFRLTATVGNGTIGAVVAAIVQGFDTLYHPASMFNNASVAQVAG